MKEPVGHIERPRLPWRPENDATLTECGFEAVKVKTLTRSEFARRLKEYGQQRTAILTCMTCVQTAQRWSAWEDDPCQAVDREIQWEGRWGDQHGHLLRDELRAIALLIKSHPDEFKELVNVVMGTVDFAAERRKRRGP
jgi:hypothetical protein